MLIKGGLRRMGAMLVHVSVQVYSVALNSRGFSEDEKRRIKLAEDYATENLEGKLRRDGITPKIEHSRAMAMMACKLGLSANAVAICWLHDVLEECPSITSWDIYCLFGPAWAEIVEGVIALTHVKSWMSDDVYYRRIKNASKDNWEVAVIKLIDRWHFHSDSYNGSVDGEKRKIKQTNGIFQATIRECEAFVPGSFKPRYVSLLNEVLGLAKDRQDILNAA